MVKHSLLNPWSNLRRPASFVVAVVGVFACTASALAEDGDVLPACEKPHGYSLRDMAEETAVYNTGESAGLTEPVPDVPFSILTPSAMDVTVKLHTTLYVPVYFADNSGPPSTPGFPKHIRDKKTDEEYLLALADALAGAYIEAFFVQVDDDEPVALDDDYVSGVDTPTLPDGTPAGDKYIVSATFISPLERGTHTVSLGGIINDMPVVFLTYTVNVE